MTAGWFTERQVSSAVTDGADRGANIETSSQEKKKRRKEEHNQP
jgi:hypothetical protein